ncbi:MAG: hypothetical protein Q4F57_05555 [Weeksellaceae bacterium]|nr:hypothetical protein [Weeksellaceae bacterium]
MTEGKTAAEGFCLSKIVSKPREASISALINFINLKDLLCQSYRVNMAQFPYFLCNSWKEPLWQSFDFCVEETLPKCDCSCVYASKSGEITLRLLATLAK